LQEESDPERLNQLMVHDDIAMLLYQSGFGNEHLTLETKCKAEQCILFNQVFKSRPDQIEDLTGVSIVAG